MATPATNSQREWVLDTLKGFWAGVTQHVTSLALVCRREPYIEQLPPQFVSVTLPDWAQHCGVDGALLLPAPFLQPGIGPDWQRVDWLGCAFWYLHACAERTFEEKHGPIHSFRFRLKGWDDRHWDHPWVNRIALFLREWAARQLGRDAQSCFGDLPRAEVVLTHDVDAIRKTYAIRFKQAAFHGFNALRCWRRGQWHAGAEKARHAVRFFREPASYWRFDELVQMESQLGLMSQFYFYGGRGGILRRPRDLLLDPGYCVDMPALRSVMRTLHNTGYDIGLHPSFASWNDVDRLGREKSRLEKALGEPVTQVRMHWLRFSWRDTWRAQEACGLRHDATLGFNDRPGFRNAAALTFHPWDDTRQQPMALRATPMTLMDSQVYDYCPTDAEERRVVMARFIREMHQVAGQATIIWHPHVLSPDYGWADGYRDFLQLLASEKSGEHAHLSGSGNLRKAA